MYVADQFVLPRLEPEAIQAIAAGTASFDAFVRDYIHSKLGYRFVEAADGGEARQLEDHVRRGGLRTGPPTLNPR